MKRGLLIIAILAAAFAQDKPKDDPGLYSTSAFTSNFMASTNTCSSLQISDGVKVTVTIGCHGDVTFGDGVTPTAAAKVFASEVTRLWPEMCGSVQTAIVPK